MIIQGKGKKGFVFLPRLFPRWRKRLHNSWKLELGFQFTHL